MLAAMFYLASMCIDRLICEYNLRRSVLSVGKRSMALLILIVGMSASSCAIRKRKGKAKERSLAPSYLN